MRRALLSLGMAALLAGPFALPTLAQQDDEYPPEGTGLTLHDSDGNVTGTFFAGETGTIDATGLLADTTYDSKFDQSPGVVIGTGESNDDGELHDTFRIPTGADNGPATFCLDPRGTSEGDVCVGIQIVSEAAAQGDVTLPKTGSSISQYLWIGAGLVAFGTVLVAMVRRRRGGKASSEAELQNV
ncbi:MAG: LPXTG cell wall anchor domain-containing protein [Actinomycetota bacterium]